MKNLKTRSEKENTSEREFNIWFLFHFIIHKHTKLFHLYNSYAVINKVLPISEFIKYSK